LREPDCAALEHGLTVFAALFSWWHRRRTRSYRVTPEDWAAAEKQLPFLAFLPAADRPRLRELALEFLAAKEMAAAEGFCLTDEIRLCIALQACLPILNLGLEWYSGWVGVIVYPGDFLVPRKMTDAAGVVHEYNDVVLGEAWVGGPVIVSWQPERATPDQRVNVVIHEFAHKLDMLDGGVDGVPRLRPGMSRRAWIDAFEPTFRDFRTHVRRGQATWLDPYAAENPAEFFAVTTEAFFETPALLKEDCPEVYGQLSHLFGLDPASSESVPSARAEVARPG
jgi:MtfA peptidase